MENKRFALSKIEIAALIADVVYFVVVIGCFLFKFYLLALCFFVLFALCAMLVIISLYERATDNLADIAEDLTDAKYTLEKKGRIDDALMSVTEKKEQLELAKVVSDELIEKLEQQAADNNRIIDELKTQLEYKNQELNDSNMMASDQRESLLKKSLLPNPDNERSERISIIDLAKESAEEIRAFASKAGIDIRFNCNDEKLWVQADRTRLHVLFKNIMDNSVKYMGKPGQIIITISAVEDVVFIVLRDNGNGLPTEEVGRIFELNYQGSNRISGDGLGLAQAKAIVEYYGGRIYARSSRNSGMAIYIQLLAN